MLNDIDLHLNDKSKTQKEDVIERNTKEKKLTEDNLNPDNYGSNYILHYNDIALTIPNIYKMTMDEREEIAKYVFNFYRNGGFPYPKFNDEKLLNDWDKLKNFDTSSLLKENNIISSGSSTGTYIWKHFCECFYQIKEDGKKSRSLYEVFQNDELLMKVIRNRLGITFIYRGEHFAFNICGQQIKQGIRSTRMGATTSIFKPTLAKYFYDNYAPENGIVFDYSVGLGQRMLGAVSSNKNLTYIGCDPWNEAIKTNQNIIDYLQTNNQNIKDRIQLHQIGTESFCPDELKEKVDLSFSSPPYYSKEVYSNEETQAYHNRTYEQFINEWWDKVIKNVNYMTKLNGYLIINMVEKYKKVNILEDMLKVVKDNGFEEVKRYGMLLSKSHLSGKVGKDKPDLQKLEPIIVLKKVR